jgi:hypothetical protein
VLLIFILKFALRINANSFEYLFLTTTNMKKLTYAFLAILFVGATFIISCKKSSSTTTTTITGPSIHLLTGSGYISKDTSVGMSSALLFGISATAGNGNLTRLLVQRTFNGKAKTAADTTINVTSFNYNLHSVSQGAIGVETWLFKIYDSNKDSASVNLTVTTLATASFK